MAKKDKVKKVVEKDGYEPNEKEIKVIDEVYQRFNDMDAARQEYVGLWNDGDKAYRQDNSGVVNVDDWRSKIVIPLSFSMVESAMAELEDGDIGIIARPVEKSDEKNAKVMQSIIDFTWKKGNGDIEWMKTIKSALIRGTGIGKETYRLDRKVVKEVEDFDMETQEIKWEEKEVFEYDDVYYMNIDLFDFYIDEMANDRGIESARDCIEKEVLDIERFREKYAKYPNVEYVKVGGDTSNDQYYEKAEDAQQQEVEVLHYYNQIRDLYLIVANRVLLTEHDKPMPWNHKKLPFIKTTCFSLIGQFYGWGYPKVLEGLQAEIDTVRRMALDNSKLQINKMFMVSDNAIIDDDELVTRPGGLITLYGEIDKNIKALDFPPLGRDWLDQYEQLRKDAVRAVGISEEMLSMPQAESATQAAIMKESGQKRIRLINKFFKKEGLIPLGRLRVANIQQFYDKPKVVKMVNPTTDKEEDVEQYRTIRIDGKAKSYFFEATPEMIRGSFDIEVDTENIIPISKALQRQQEIELYNLTVQNPVVDPNKATKKLYEAYDKNPYDYIAEPKQSGTTPESQVQAAFAHHDALMKGEDVPPSESPTPEHIGAHLDRMKRDAALILKDKSIQGLMAKHLEAERQMVEGQPPESLGSEGDMQAATGNAPQGSRYASAPAVANMGQAQPQSMPNRGMVMK